MAGDRTSELPRVTPADRKALFEMDGLEWAQCGHYADTNNLEVARAAMKRLIELGYRQLQAHDLNGYLYEFKFIAPHDGPFEIVTLLYRAVSFETRPRWEIALEGTDGQLCRFGKHTYVGDAQVDGLDYGRAHDYARQQEVPGSVITQPTLDF